MGLAQQNPSMRQFERPPVYGDERVQMSKRAARLGASVPLRRNERLDDDLEAVKAGARRCISEVNLTADATQIVALEGLLFEGQTPTGNPVSRPARTATGNCAGWVGELRCWGGADTVSVGLIGQILAPLRMKGTDWRVGMSVKWRIPCRGALVVVRCRPIYAAWRKTFLTTVYCFAASQSWANDKSSSDSDYCTEKWSSVVMQVAKIARSSRREIPPLLFVGPEGSTYNCLEAQLDDDVVTNFENWHKDIATIKRTSDGSSLDQANSSYCVADIGTYQDVKIIGIILPIEGHILGSFMCENAIRNSLNFMISGN